MKIPEGSPKGLHVAFMRRYKDTPIGLIIHSYEYWYPYIHGHTRRGGTALSVLLRRANVIQAGRTVWLSVQVGRVRHAQLACIHSEKVAP